MRDSHPSLTKGRSVTGRRFCRLLAGCFLAAMSLAIAAPQTKSTVHIGTGYANMDTAWDFSDSTSCSLFSGPCGDFATGITLAGVAPLSPCYMFLFATRPDALIAVAKRDSSYDEITTAPEDSALYHVIVSFCPEDVYFIRTSERHCAKIRAVYVSGGVDLTFEFSYQDDGTRILVDTVAVRETTWGRIKALYQTGGR